MSTTVTLRNGAPKDFRMPKTYRPVDLLNTLSKIPQSIVTTPIAWVVEEYGILPKPHLGGRKGMFVDNVIQLILDRIHRVWGVGKKVSMLILDQAATYDNVSHQRLLSNVRKLRLRCFAPWIQFFLTGRSTKIKLPASSPIYS